MDESYFTNSYNLLNKDLQIDSTTEFFDLPELEPQEEQQEQLINMTTTPEIPTQQRAMQSFSRQVAPSTPSGGGSYGGGSGY